MTNSLVKPPQYPGAKLPFAPEKGFPNWNELVQEAGKSWHDQIASASGTRVLVGTNTGMHGAVSTFDSLLSCALTQAGAQVSRIFCDGSIPACLIPVYGEATPPEMIAERKLVDRLCKACFNRGTHTHRPLGLPEFRFSEFLQDEDYINATSIAAGVDIGKLPEWTLDGISVGEHAYAGALRYFAKGDLNGELLADEILLRYLEGAIITKWVYERVIEAWKPDVVVLHHGIYSPQGIAADVCRKAGVKVVTWVVAYRKSCFIFSHDDTYHHTMMSEPVETWENINLSEAQRAELYEYLGGRAKGSGDWIYFHEEPSADFQTYAQNKDIDLNKPLVSILTNVMWDAQLHYPANAFRGMEEWIVETVRHFIDKPELEVAVRIHPAEVRGSIKSRQCVADILAKAFPILPRHIHIIEPDEEASTYALANASNAVIIYGTKMGTELAPMGKPIIVGGEAWIRNKGLTQDAKNKEDYFSILNKLPYADDANLPDKARAEKYAYHFFFRRMIPLTFLEPNGTGAMFGFEFDSINDIKPGNHTGLDVITNGIMHGSPFVYQAENGEN